MTDKKSISIKRIIKRIIQMLDKHASAIQAIFTVLLVVVTTLYVIFTYNMSNTMSKQFELLSLQQSNISEQTRLLSQQLNYTSTQVDIMSKDYEAKNRPYVGVINPLIDIVNSDDLEGGHIVFKGANHVVARVGFKNFGNIPANVTVEKMELIDGNNNRLSESPPFFISIFPQETYYSLFKLVTPIPLLRQGKGVFLIRTSITYYPLGNSNKSYFSETDHIITLDKDTDIVRDVSILGGSAV